jgi:hypothetical protein
MRISLSGLAYFACACCIVSAPAQTPATNTDVADALLDHMIATNVLTTPGAPPFHAILEISSEASSATEHHGRIEVFWADPTSYYLKLETPEFGQTLIVNGDKVQESDRGDFYPGWVQDFVAALLDPMARAKDLRGHPNAYSDAPAFAYFCIKRDDRRNGITDDLTFAQVCHNKSLGRTFPTHSTSPTISAWRVSALSMKNRSLTPITSAPATTPNYRAYSQHLRTGNPTVLS